MTDSVIISDHEIIVAELVSELESVLISGTDDEIHVLMSGEQGPPGRDGASVGGAFYQHTQLSPASAIWTVNHNFGRYANVDVYSPGGMRLLVDVLQVSINQVQILFDGPATGFAICS